MGYFLKNVITVSTLEVMHIGSVPAMSKVGITFLVPVANINRNQRSVYVRVKKERKRIATTVTDVAHPVRRRAIQSAGELFQHISDITDKRPGDRRRVYPPVARLNL